MKRVVQCIATALLASLLVACVKQESDPAPADGIPALLRDIIEANRAVALPPFHPNFDAMAQRLLTQGLTLDGDLRVSERVQRLPIMPEPGQTDTEIQSDRLDLYITRDEIIDEIYFLFDLLKHAYAGYQYFGGDDVFIPLRDLMLEEIEDAHFPFRISAYLNDILVPFLKMAIADNHFSAHDKSIGARLRSPLLNDDYILRMESGEYFFDIDGARHRLVETRLRDGRAVDGVLPTISPEGEFVFAFGLFAYDDDWSARALIALVENVATGERVELELSLPWVRNHRAESLPLLLAREQNGVPIIENRTLLSSDMAIDTSADFYREGAAMRGTPVIVLDLRGNSGGVFEPMRRWIAGFTGQRLPGAAFAQFQLRSLSNGMGAGRPGFPPTWGAIARGDAQAGARPNQSLLVVLIDNNVASAGDLIVGHLREFENVIFVGANTGGALIAGGLIRSSLPNSGLDLRFGTSLSLRPDFSQFEGVGFMPDLWVQPEESLQRALAFIERYGLNRARN